MRYVCYVLLHLEMLSHILPLYFKGLQNRTSRISKIPTTGLTKWSCSVSPHGFVTSETMLDIVGDLRDHIVAEEIPTPVIMFMDGYKAHYSVAIWDFCKVMILKLSYGVYKDTISFLQHVICHLSDM